VKIADIISRRVPLDFAIDSVASWWLYHSFWTWWFLDIVL
jgi:hypothetical protein